MANTKSEQQLSPATLDAITSGNPGNPRGWRDDRRGFGPEPPDRGMSRMRDLVEQSMAHETTCTEGKTLAIACWVETLVTSKAWFNSKSTGCKTFQPAQANAMDRGNLGPDKTSRKHGIGGRLSSAATADQDFSKSWTNGSKEVSVETLPRRCDTSLGSRGTGPLPE